MLGTDYVGRHLGCRRTDTAKACFPKLFHSLSVNRKILVEELPESSACSKEVSRHRHETQGIPMVFHCALRGRRLQGPRFVLDVPGSSPATPSKRLMFLRVVAYLSIIVRFGGVVFF